METENLLNLNEYSANGWEEVLLFLILVIIKAYLLTVWVSISSYMEALSMP